MSKKEQRPQTSRSKKPTPNGSAGEQPGNVVIATAFTGSIYKRLATMKRDKGFMKDQDVIRAAVSFFLDQSGY